MATPDSPAARSVGPVVSRRPRLGGAGRRRRAGWRALAAGRLSLWLRMRVVASALALFAQSTNQLDPSPAAAVHPSTRPPARPCPRSAFATAAAGQWSSRGFEASDRTRARGGVDEIGPL